MSDGAAATPGRPSAGRGRALAHALGLTRADRWPLALVLAVMLALWAPRLRGPIDLRWDAGVYYLAGSALVEGRGYVIPSEPGTVAEIQYPPALPLLAAAVQKVVGTDAVAGGHAMRLLYLAMSLVYAAAVYVVARRYLPLGWATLATLLTVLHAYTLFLSSLMQAELPYALVTTLFLVLAAPRPGRRWRPAPEPPPGPLADALAGLSFFVRTAGVALLGAWVLDLLLRRRWRRAAIAVLVAVACVGGWQLHVARAQAERARAAPAYAYQYAPYQFYNVSYQTNLALVDPFRPELGPITTRQVALRTVANVRALVREIGELVTADGVWWVNRVPYRGDLAGDPAARRPWQAEFWARVPFAVVWRLPLALAVLPFVGFALLAWRGAWIVPLYALASLVLIVLTPWPGQFWRYLAPLMPLFTIAAAVALAALVSMLRRALARRRARPAGLATRLLPWVPSLAVAALMLGVQLTAQGLIEHDPPDVAYAGRDGRPVRYHLMWYDSTWRSHDAAIDWIATRADSTAIVVTTTPHWVYLRTGLRSVMPPFEADPARADSLMATLPGRFLILDHLGFIDSSRRYGAPVVERFPERWRLVFDAGAKGSAVYERVGTGTAGEPTRAGTRN